MKKQLTVLLTIVGLVGALFAGLTVAKAQTTSPSTPPTGVTKAHPKGTEQHPAIHRAIKALEAAKLDLQQANHDFGGHRKQALEDCDKAIAQLKLALQYDKK